MRAAKENSKREEAPQRAEMDEKLQRLVVIASTDDAGELSELINSLRERFQVDRCGSLKDSQRAILRGECSGILADWGFLSSHGKELQAWLEEEKLDIPTIAMSRNGKGSHQERGKKQEETDACASVEVADIPIACTLIANAIERHELQRHIKLLNQIVEHASDCIITMDTSGKILTANNAAEDIFGYARHRLVGQDATMLFPAGESNGRSREMLKASANGVAWGGEIYGRRSDGSLFPADVSLSFVRDEDGKPQTTIAVGRDITERQELLSRLKRQSITDDLTGLFNYRYFHARLRYEFLRAKRYEHPLSCILIDLDYFKSVNDAYGHQEGDGVLRAVAHAIRNATRTVDIVARYGGEEFVIVLPNTDLDGTLRCAEHVWEGIRSTDLPVHNSHIRITASLGIATLEPDIANEEDLLRRADDALMQAKQEGRDSLCLWRDEGPRTAGTQKNKLSHVQQLKSHFRRLVQSVKGTFLAAANPIISAVEARDPYSNGHTSDVATFATELARHIALPPEDVETIRYAAMLHDVGKIVMNVEIFTKKTPLTPEEREMVRRHPLAGADAAAELGFLNDELVLIRHHHERWDGDGYPDGLSEEEIPLGARILALADAFDAMTADRPHREALSPNEAKQELQRQASKQFDPALVKAFLEMQTETG